MEITLTPQQIEVLKQGVRDGTAEVTLTDEQFAALRRSHPEARNRTAHVALSGSGTSAPFLPGGSVVRASVSAIGNLKLTLGG